MELTEVIPTIKSIPIFNVARKLESSIGITVMISNVGARRAIGATSTEKATVDKGSLNAVETNREENMAASQAPKACSILDPDCEACQ